MAQNMKADPIPVTPIYPHLESENQRMYPQPPPSYEEAVPSSPPLPKTTHYTPGPTIVVSPAVGSEPTVTICPSCRAEILTRTSYRNTTRTHIMAAVLCLFVCWPCAFVPYLMDSCKNVDHNCPHCDAYIGTYQR